MLSVTTISIILNRDILNEDITLQRTSADQKVNLKLYDVDGCLYHKLKQGERDGANVHQWLIDSNKAFLESQIAEVKADKYDKVIVAYGTNRQSRRVDDYAGLFRGGSCTPVLPILQSYLAGNLNCPVVADPFWMADIYGGKSAGTSYKLALMDRQKIPHKEQHSLWMFDVSKVSLLYAQIHRAATLNPDAKQLDVDFYDDTYEILNQLEVFFKVYPQLLPKNVTLRLHHYAGEKVSKPCVIKGEGIVDKNYEWSVRFMASMSCIHSEYDGDYSYNVDKQIKTAKELQTYCPDLLGPERKLDPSSYFDFKRFNDMRDKEIPKLVAASTLGNKSNYITADLLLQAKLIPEIYLLKSKMAEEKKEDHPLSQQEAFKLQRNSFCKIYCALRDGRSGVKSASFLTGMDALSDEEFIKKVEAHAQEKTSITADAWTLAKNYYQHFDINNINLRSEIYAESLRRSGMFSKSSAAPYLKIDTDSILPHQKKIPLLDRETMEEGKMQENSRRQKIINALAKP